ncbi:uncharacterized protein EI90DRAFT_533207 [Cantharellus anzutake]|uniref:uncharacterized protein n=1 Tax=Cantharellus anzutake TaxID=1750568 RepID=UPI0019070B60|nr:uncharacterized protein EI90DRAFT_533207 [Cantharellus anzutake]KAF8334285.1 hypothetical protein EI90DRAFT_533207 [Cantharellus anzutake]
MQPNLVLPSTMECIQRCQLFSSQHALRSIAERAHKPHKCLWGHCSRIFPSRQMLHRHMKHHTLQTSPDPRYRCYWGECSSVLRFDTGAMLYDHMLSEHIVSQPWECPFMVVLLHNWSTMLRRFILM